MPSNSPTSSSLQLWFARVGDLTTDIEDATEQLLSRSEQKRLRATGNQNKRREFLLSRALMRHALTQHSGLAEQHWKFREQPNQPPTISNLPAGTHFSLSHSKGYICFALASCPIGIDLEKIRDKRDFKGLAKAVMNEEEIEFLERQPEHLAENFYRIWCAKEACYKLLPSQKQSSLSLKGIPVLKLLQEKNAKGPILVIQKNSQFMLAIALKTKLEQINCHHFPGHDPLMAAFSQGFVEGK